MRITKGKLKQIIAEEHAIVYGRKPRGSRKIVRNPNRRRRMDERWARESRQLLAEVGFFDMLKGAVKSGAAALGALGTSAAKSAGTFIQKQASNAKKAAQDAAKSIANYADQGWSEWAQGYAKEFEEKFTNDMLDSFEQLLRVIAKDGREKNEEGKWEKLSPEAAQTMAMDILSAAIKAAEAKVMAGAPEKAEGANLTVLDGGKSEEGELEAAGYVRNGSLLEGYFAKENRKRKLNEAKRSMNRNKRLNSRRRTRNSRKIRRR